ncbi:unnamed protein product [Sphagnum compactum]
MLMTGFLRDPEETLEMERDAKFLARRQELMHTAAAGRAEGWSTLGEPAFQFQTAAAVASDANHFCKHQQQLQMEHMATDDSGKMSTNSGFSVKPAAVFKQEFIISHPNSKLL